jgi:hypothetical protein
MAVFTVVNQRGRTVLETDDWVDAQAATLDTHSHRLAHDDWLSVRGTHPTHDWGPPLPGQGDSAPHARRCVKCGGWDNGSYGSQAPCGYDFAGASLVAVIARELASRAKCIPACPPAHREHLNHMTDGRWHDNCPYCLERRAHGGTGLERVHGENP